MLDKIDYKNLNDIVYHKIKSSIIDNVFKPGDKLSAESLSKQLGVSRTPVSNALKALEIDGYVVIYPQSGTYVRELSSEELSIIYDLRELIEGLVAKLIIPIKDKSKLQEYYTEFKNYMNIHSTGEEVVYDFYDLELRFHDYLISLCPSIIRSEIENIIDLTKRSRKLNLQYEITNKDLTYIKEKDINIHIKLIEAFMNDDTCATEKYAKQDVKDTKDEVLKNFYNIEQNI